jgi:hypothetical protein
MALRHNQSGMIPNTPNEQSINRQKSGIPRNGPQISAKGTINTQAIIPNSTTHMFLSGLLSGPQKAIAMTT